MAAIKNLPDRSQVKQEDTWAMEDLFSTDERWEEEYQCLQKDLQNIQGYRGKLKDSPDILLEALSIYSECARRTEKIVIYANQKLHEDTRNGKYQDFTARAKNLEVELGSLSAYLEPEILLFSEKELEGFIYAKEELKEFEHFLYNIIRKKSHILDSVQEELLSKAGEFSDSAEDIYSMFNNADIKFPTIKNEEGEEVEITHGRYIGFQQSMDRRVRKDSFEGFYKAYESFENTLAAIFTANIKKDTFFAKIRGYSSAREESLDKNNIPIKVYDNLIQTIHESLPFMHRYISLRKKALGVEQLHMYDVYVPLVSDSEKEVSFEKAKEMVLEGLKPMREEYLEKLREGFANRWIDVYENMGKRTGAYSWGAYGIHPYVLLNYSSRLDDVFTLAHEMGHALHSYYSDQNQSYINAGYCLFVAEVASTCNEALLLHDMLKHSKDRQEKAYLLNQFLEKFRGTIFRQTMFAEFEMMAHDMAEKGESLNAEVLKKMYHQLNELYFGPDMIVDSQIDMEWARIPHFYTSFYVYQYATGFSAAIALSNRILELGEEGVKDYMKFLTGGCSQYPIDLLKAAGVDMSSPKPIQEAMSMFENLLNQFEELID